MTVTMELPAAGLTETPHPTLHVVSEESQEAVAAAAALETPEVELEEVTVRIKRNIDDAVSGFAAVKGETFTANINIEGDTFIPWQGEGGEIQEIYLEPNEFEIVEALPDGESAPTENTTENTTNNATETPAAGGCAVGETPATTNSDQPAPGTPQAEPATPPAMLPATVEIIDQAAKRTVERERYLANKSAMEERLAGLTIEEMKLKEQAKLCKKEREVLAEQLSNLIDGWERGPAPDAAQPEPATAGGTAENPASPCECKQHPQDSDSAPAGQLPADTATVAPVAETDQDRQDRYRRVLESADIKELSLPKAIEERLVESAVGNLWALEMLRGDISQGKAKWPKGIGEAKVTKIENASSEWVARNRATWEVAAEPAETLPRTAEQMDVDNRQAEIVQEAKQDAEVDASGVSPPKAAAPAAARDELLDL